MVLWNAIQGCFQSSIVGKLEWNSSSYLSHYSVDSHVRSIIISFGCPFEELVVLASLPHLQIIDQRYLPILANLTITLLATPVPFDRFLEENRPLKLIIETTAPLKPLH